MVERFAGQAKEVPDRCLTTASFAGEKAALSLAKR